MWIVRIATHPSANSKGYGSKALELLQKYYSGELMDLDNIKTNEVDELSQKLEFNLKDGKYKPRKGLKPIL